MPSLCHLTGFSIIINTERMADSSCRWLAPVLFLSAFSLVSSRAYSHNECSTVSVKDHYIIDIRKSVGNGAVLLNGTQAASSEDCTAMCCATNKCRLSVYRKERASSTKTNCYLVDCGSDPANCKLVGHLGFTSTLLGPGSVSSDGE